VFKNVLSGYNENYMLSIGKTLILYFEIYDLPAVRGGLKPPAEIE
jgi:hypothetical protein